MANYAEHHATVTVNAPVHQVYALFTHFNDFPKYMHFIDQVTYIDNMRSHWIADVVGRRPFGMHLSGAVASLTSAGLPPFFHVRL